MEGLEISVLNLTEILIENEEFRFDSEYFKKNFLAFDKFIKTKKSNKIGAFAKVSDGDHSKFPDNQLDEVRYLQAKDIKNHFILNDNPVYVSKSYFDKNKRSHVKEENVILSIMGSVGDIAITPKGFKPTLSNRAIAIIKNIKDVNPYYLFAYLSSEYGQLQINRQKNGGVQQRINLDVLSKVKIPYVNSSFENQVESVVKLSQEIRFKSIEVYQTAEKTLLQELGLNDFKAIKAAVNIKSFSESFAMSGRLDAEYYQTKYDVIEDRFDNFKRLKLSELVIRPISSGVTPKAGGDAYTDENNGVPFVRAVDLQDGEVLISNFNYIKHEIHDGILKRTQLKKGDVLLSIAGTVGRSSIFTHDFKANINQAVCILRFNETQIMRLYLVVFFNSFVGKEFVSKYSRQGVQTNLSLSEVGDLSIPIIDYNKQKLIVELVKESFKLKKQSEHLLEVAKTAVEVAIEQNEQKAMEYINLNTTE